MKKVYKIDIDFKSLKNVQYNQYSTNCFYIDEENNKLYKMFEYGMFNPDTEEKKLIEIEKLNKSYISNPIELVYTYDLDLDGYVQKYIKGETLKDLVNYRNLLDYIKHIVTVSKDLEDLHNNNVVVGDIGFHNIMINEENKPIFIDVDSMSINDIKSRTVSLLLSNYYGRKNRNVEIGENSDNIGLYLALFKVIFGRELAVISNDTYLHEISSFPILADLYPIYNLLTRRNEVIPEVPYLHKVLKNYN